MLTTVWRNWLHVWPIAVPAAFVIFLLTIGLALLSIRLAPRLGLMDRPGGRKDHAAPTPAIGGLAIALSCLCVFLFLFPAAASLQALAIAGGILLVTGAADDLYDLPWPIRLCAHAVSALVLVYVGKVQVNSIGTAFGVNDYHQLGSLAAPFTVLATTGLINALNMADGIDGLASSIGLAALTMLTGAALYAGNRELAIDSLVFASSLAGFLALNIRSPWNPRARAFLGNAGSEILGLIIAWICFRLTQTPAHPVTPVLAPFLIAVPVIDCLVLMAHRIRRRRSPFAADRNHLHHLLMDAGFSVSGVVLLTLGLCLTIGLLAALALLRHVPQPLFIAAFLALMAGHFAFTADRQRAVRSLSRLASRRVADPASADVTAAKLCKRAAPQPFDQV